mmetsp:Transcript_61772/g.127702  ORF Transcript_61772/g.127702 Transcript_61772/m.127702 type:complete len:1753 (+) Transcript_61772:15-5273(+)
MAAAAAAAAQAAAAAVQAIANNQANMLAALQAQQNVLQQQFEERQGSKKEPEELKRGAAYYNPWALGVASHLATKNREWALELTDASMVLHPSYPADAPPNPANPAAQAAAQLVVDEKRRKVQTELHALLVRTCKDAYFTECSNVRLNFPNCGSMLWRAIYLENNPDGEAQTNSLRAGMRKKIAKFNGEWNEWIEHIELINTQLTHLGEPFPDREFRELMFKAIKTSPGWANWVELQMDKRPAPTFHQLKLLGQSKWAELHEGDISSLIPADKKKESASMAVEETETAAAVSSSAGHNPKNCKNANCKHDHGDLTFCSYHGKWTGHVRERCNMLKEDISLQKEARYLRSAKRGGGKGGGQPRPGKKGDAAHRGRDNERGGGRGGHEPGLGLKKRRYRGEDDSSSDGTPPPAKKKGKAHQANFCGGIVHCSMALTNIKSKRAHGGIRALVDSGCSSHLHPNKFKLVNLRSCNKRIKFADQRSVAASWIGDWPVKAKDKHGNWHSTLFKNVLVCPDIADPILSVRRIQAWGHDVVYAEGANLVLNARNGFETIKIPLQSAKDTGLYYLAAGDDYALESEHALAADDDESDSDHPPSLAASSDTDEGYDDDDDSDAYDDVDGDDGDSGDGDGDGGADDDADNADDDADTGDDDGSVDNDDDDEPPEMCASDSDTESDDDHSPDQEETALLAAAQGTAKPAISRQPVDEEESDDDAPPSLCSDTESDSENEEESTTSRNIDRHNVKKDIVKDDDGEDDEGITRPSDDRRDVYRNQQLDPQVNDKYQRIAMRLHLDTNHTHIRHLMQIAPNTVGLEELLTFPSNFVMEPCWTCMQSNSRAKPRPAKTAQRAPYPNYRWFSDLTGKMRVKSWEGHQYGGVIVDDCSGDIETITLKHKSDLPQEYDRVVRQQGVTPKYLRTDGGGEFVGKDFEKRIAKDGTHHEKSAPDWQNQNGRAESAIGRIGARSRVASRHANAPAGVWWRSWHYAGLCERVTKPYDVGKKRTSYEVRMGKQFDIRKLVPFGCYAVPHIKTHKRLPGKNADRAKPGIFVGYGHSEGYSACLILDPSTRKTAKVPYEQVTFHKDEFPWRNPKGKRWPPLDIAETPDEYTVVEEGDVMCHPDSEPYVLNEVRTRAKAAAEAAKEQLAKDLAATQEESTAPPATSEPEQQEPPAAGTEAPADPDDIRRAAELGESIYFDELAAVFCGHAVTDSRHDPKFLPDPRTWEEAMRMPDWREWLKSALAERRNLKTRKSFRILSRREVKRLLKKKVKIHTGRNVMKKKINHLGNPYKHKSRATLRGFSEVERFDFHETFAAVASSAIVRLIIALAVGAGLTMHQLDVVGAYLNAHMAEELYMWAPDGIAKYENECWQILSSVYGTRQAGADWKELFVKLLKEFGFVAANLDETLFVLKSDADDRVIIVVLYVDDAIVAENWPSRYNKFLQFMQRKLEITDEGALHWYLSVSYQHSKDGTRVLASQTGYIEKVARAHGLDPDARSGPKTPMDSRFTVDPDDIPEDEDVDPVLRTKTKRILGSLLFPAGWCRPDCSYAVNRLARHAAKPFPAIYDAALRVLKYMVRTKGKGIRFSSRPQDRHGHKLNELYCYCDASFADDPLKRRSTIGYIIFMNGSPICYRTKLAPTFVGSSTHAELAAACMAAQDIVQLRTVLETLGFAQDGPTPIYEDNESCIAIANNKRSTHNKHIDVRYEIVRDYVRLMEIVFVPCRTDQQKADFMTKALARLKFADNADFTVFDESSLED